jgi:chromosome partitioning protein
MPPKILAVAAHKGGVGKTTTAMSLSAALALAGKKVLLVDLDPQGHSTLGLGIELGDDEPSLRDIFTDRPLPFEKIVRETQRPGLHIAPSNIRLERIAQMLYSRTKREELLGRALAPVRNRYDFIVLDCPPSLGPLTEGAIAAADLIIIPSLMEGRAVDSVVDLLEVIGLIRGEDFKRYRILRTRVDGRKSITNEAVMAALADWQSQMFSTHIPQSEALNQAGIARVDVFSFDNNSKGAQAYQHLAEEILHGK